MPLSDSQLAAIHAIPEFQLTLKTLMSLPIAATVEDLASAYLDGKFKARHAYEIAGWPMVTQSIQAQRIERPYLLLIEAIKHLDDTVMALRADLAAERVIRNAPPKAVRQDVKQPVTKA